MEAKTTFCLVICVNIDSGNPLGNIRWYFFVTVFFIVYLHKVSAKKLTDSTLARAVIQPLLEVKPPKPFGFTKHEVEKWPRW